MERQLISIKGTKEGFIFAIDDEGNFDEIYDELVEKLPTTTYQLDEDVQSVSVTIKLGNRYLSDEERDRLKEMIEKNSPFYVKRFDSEVVLKKEAEDWLNQSEVKMMTQIVRSGQVLNIEGDLLLIGDVNPGGQVRATGNIFIMGQLNGIAHAGCEGDKDAVIAASYMNPSQLRIANFISRSPDFESEGVYMECGYYHKDKNKIIIDRLQVLPYVRKELRGLERRILNG